MPLRLRALFGRNPWLAQRVGNITRVGFVRSVTVLVGGTAFAQGLTVLALPLLTRLYAPSDLGLLAVYTALLGILSIAACLRFDIAIPLPASDADAASLLAAALVSSAAVSLVVGAVSIFAAAPIASLLKTPELSSYLWLLPIGVFFTSVSSALQFWATRKRAFARIARVRIEQAIGGVGVQVGLGIVGMKPIGLIIGQVVNGGAGVLGLARRAVKEDKLAMQSITLGSINRLARAYDRFPRFSTFDSLANVASLQLPVLVVAAQASTREAGFLLLAMRIMQAPMGIVGSAISQVYLARAPDEFRAGNLSRFTQKVLAGLVRSGVGPLIFAGLVAPSVVDLIFGSQWHRAGQLLLWMMPWFVIQFLVSPISMVLHVTNKQHVALALNVSGIVVRAMPVAVAAYYGLTSRLPEILAVSSLAFYLLWFAYCLKVSGTSVLRVFEERHTNAILGAWILVALVIRIGFEILT